MDLRPWYVPLLTAGEGAFFYVVRAAIPIYAVSIAFSTTEPVAGKLAVATGRTMTAASVNSVFFLSYMLCQIPMSAVVSYFGAVLVVVVATALQASLMLLVAVMFALGLGDSFLLFFVATCTGLLASSVSPTSSVLVNEYVDKERQARALSLFSCIVQVAVSIGTMLIPWMAESFTLAMPSLLLCICGAAVVFSWVYYFYVLLKLPIVPQIPGRSAPSWKCSVSPETFWAFWAEIKPLMQYKAYWVVVAVQICDNTTEYLFSVYMASFFVSQLGLPLGEIGTYLAIPPILRLFMLPVVSAISDRQYERLHGSNPFRLRTLFIVVSMVGSGSCVLVLMAVGMQSPFICCILLCVMNVFFALQIGGYNVAYLDVTGPRYTAIGCGWGNAMAQIGGIVIGIMVGELGNSTAGWQLLFVGIALLQFAGAMLFALGGDGIPPLQAEQESGNEKEKDRGKEQHASSVEEEVMAWMLEGDDMTERARQDEGL